MTTEYDGYFTPNDLSAVDAEKPPPKGTHAEA